MAKMLGTRDIPEEHWTDARLIGRVPFLACQAEPRISYCLYVPQKDYRNEPDCSIPLIVSVHGSGRRAEHCREVMIPLADELGAAILAPLFPACLGDANEMHGYKILSSNGIRFDLALLAILDEIDSRSPAVQTDKFHLAGFSGGGQFALRFFYLYPDRLHSVCVGAPGTCTRLDRSVSWPLGIKDVEAIFDDRTMDVSKLMRVKTQLVVGAEDTAEVNIGLWRLIGRATSQEAHDLPARLPNRVEALTKVRDELAEHGVDVELTIVADAAHSYPLVLPAFILWLRKVVPQSIHRLA